MEEVHRWALRFLISALQDIKCNALHQIPGGRGRKEIFHAPYRSQRIITQKESFTEFREHWCLLHCSFHSRPEGKSLSEGKKKKKKNEGEMELKRNSNMLK